MAGALDDDTPTSLSETRLELEQLRAENRRLRALLGLDRLDDQASVPTWEPTLFPERDMREAAPAVSRCLPECTPSD
jgi:hypothetical protein